MIRTVTSVDETPGPVQRKLGPTGRKLVERRGTKLQGLEGPAEFVEGHGGLEIDGFVFEDSGSMHIMRRQGSLLPEAWVRTRLLNAVLWHVEM